MQPIKQEKAFKSFRITKVGRNDLAHDHVAPKERKVNNIFFYNVGTSSSKDKIAFRTSCDISRAACRRPDLDLDRRGRYCLRLFYGQRDNCKGRSSIGPPLARI